MAATVHLSPGVYTNEVDFSQYTSRVGSIHINVVGKTPKGPAGTNTKGVKLFNNITDIQNVYGTVSLTYPTLVACKETAPWCNNFALSRVLGTLGHNKSAMKSWPIYMSSTTAPYANSDNVVGMLTSRLSASTTAPMCTNLTMVGGASGEYTITLSGADGAVCAQTVSVSESSPVFVSDIYGTSPTDSVSDYIFVERIFPDQAALISGNNGTLADWYSGFAADGVTTHNDYSDTYQAARTPWFVSDAVGGTVNKLFRLIMRYDGESSNTLVKAMVENINTTTKTFDLVLRSFTDTNANMNVVERFKGCSFDPDSTSYIKRKIGDGDEYDIQSDYVYIEMWTNVSKNAIPAGVYGIPKMDYTNWIQSPQVITISSATTAAKQAFGFNNSYIDENKLKMVPSGNTSYYSALEKGFHLSSGASSSSFSCTTSATTTISKDNMKFMTPFFGGFDGFDIFTTESYSTASGPWAVDFKAAIDVFDDAEQYACDLLLTPDTAINITDALPVVNHALDMIAPPDGRADCFYLVQMDDDRTVTDANNSLDTASLDTSWGATHWPWVKYYDSQSVKFAWGPPTAMVAKSIARTWTEKWPWIAAAGLKRGTGDGSVKDVRVQLKQADRDKLYENRINPIQKFAVENKIVVYGQKTLQVAESSLDRVNARLGLNYIKKIIAGATKYMMFDPSDVFFWAEFVAMVKPYLESMKEERGIYDFRVQMDENTNTQQIQDRNQVYGKIFLKMTKTAEDITLDFILLNSGANFDEYL